jgi:hypothetical protein
MRTPLRGCDVAPIADSAHLLASSQSADYLRGRHTVCAVASVRLLATGAHPRLAEAMADQAPDATVPPEERLGRSFGLVLDGLLPA